MGGNWFGLGQNGTPNHFDTPLTNDNKQYAGTGGHYNGGGYGGTGSAGTNDKGSYGIYGNNVWDPAHPGWTQGDPQFGGQVLQANATANQYAQYGQDARIMNQTEIAAQQNDARKAQLDSLGLSRDAAYGRAPSVAQLQMGQGIDASIAAQQAQANAARGGGGNVALAQRQAAINGAQMQQAGVSQAGLMRAQEMAAARGQYGDMAAKYGAEGLAARAQNDQTALGYAGLGNQVTLGQLSADTSRYGADQGVAVNQANNAQAMTGAGIAAGGALLAALL